MASCGKCHHARYLHDVINAPSLVDYQLVAPHELKEQQMSLERMLDRIWTDLSSFEESAAACISDMLLNFAAGATVESLRMVSQFVSHVQVLFAALDALDTTSLDIEIHNSSSISCARESKSISSYIIQLLQLLASGAASYNAKEAKQQQQGGNNNVIVAQEVLTLVTGMAQSLKALIRIGLVESLQLVWHVSLKKKSYTTDTIMHYYTGKSSFRHSIPVSAGVASVREETSVDGRALLVQG